MATVASLDELEAIVGRLAERGYARRIPRRPGQKEDRFEHLLGGAGEAAPSPRLEPEPALRAERPAVPSAGLSRPAGEPVPVPRPSTFLPPAPAPERDRLTDRVEALEREVALLRRRLEALGNELG